MASEIKTPKMLGVSNPYEKLFDPKCAPPLYRGLESNSIS